VLDAELAGEQVRFALLESPSDADGNAPASG
jgi:hypothetical protein